MLVPLRPIRARTLFGISPADRPIPRDRRRQAQEIDVTQGRRQGSRHRKEHESKVVKNQGRDIVIDICHDGYCIGNKTLKDGESDQAAGNNISGWVRYTWGMGNGNQDNQYTGVRGNAPGPYQVDFTAGNPDIGSPWIEARLPNKCYWDTRSWIRDKVLTKTRRSGYWASAVRASRLETPCARIRWSPRGRRTGGPTRHRRGGRLQDVDARGVCPGRRLCSCQPRVQLGADPRAGRPPRVPGRQLVLLEAGAQATVRHRSHARPGGVAQPRPESRVCSGR